MIKEKRAFIGGLIFISAFIIWTLLIKFVDVQAIGPRESSVGFATLNKFIHELIGVSEEMYVITDWLGLIPIGLVLFFATIGLIQWIKGKSILKVDYNILVLGVFYIVVASVYLLFEMVVVNYRPVLINGYLEHSYPSSTTMLVVCVMPTAIINLRTFIKNKKINKIATLIIAVFIAFMVIGRIVSGVHWITDIIGGVLISLGLLFLYYSVLDV